MLCTSSIFMHDALHGLGKKRRRDTNSDWTVSWSHVWHFVCLISDKLHIITRFVWSYFAKIIPIKWAVGQTNTHRIVDAKLNEFISFVLNSRRMKVEQETNKTGCITVEMQFYGYIYYYFLLDLVGFWDSFVRMKETFIKRIVIFVILKKSFGKIISSNSTAYDLKCVVYISFLIRSEPVSKLKRVPPDRMQLAKWKKECFVMRHAFLNAIVTNC